MKKLIGSLIVLGVFVTFTASTPGIVKKEVEFDVRIGSRTLGAYKVTMQALGDREDFVIEQVIEDGLLHRSKVHYRVHSQYKASQLQVMEMRNVVDDVVLQSSDLKFEDGTYFMQTDLGKIQLPEGEMAPGSVYLFFEEPKEWTSVFHEKYGIALPIRQTSDSTYEIELPNGGREVYTYANGRPVMFVVEKTFGMFSMTLKEQLAKD